MSAAKKFVLGSGELYVVPFTGTLPENATIEADSNRLGLISGGATLEYKPTFYTVQDDLGLVKEEILTAEEVTLKSGLLVPDMSFVERAAPTARSTTASSVKTTKLGGLKNADGKKYIVRFVHVSAADPDYALRVTIVGVNRSGFSLGMLKDKEVVVDHEFGATPMDSAGTLVQFDEPAAEA